MIVPEDSRRALARVAVLAALLGACATPEKLNSDRIRDRFGNFGIEIVSQDGQARRSSLYSTAGGQRIARTEALVLFENPTDDAIAGPHDTIVNGGSLGETFRSDGWQVQKNTVHIGESRIADDRSGVAQRMNLAVPAALAMHVYELHLEKGEQRVFYATVIEMHHPDYLTRGQLLDIYPVDRRAQLDAADAAALAALVLADD